MPDRHRRLHAVRPGGGEPVPELERPARHRGLPGVERGQRHELLDRHAAPDGAADQGHVERREGASTRAHWSSARPSRRASPSRPAGSASSTSPAVDGVPAWRSSTSSRSTCTRWRSTAPRSAPPEKSMELLAKASAGCSASAGVPASKPIWNTEVNYGMRTGAYGGTRGQLDLGRAPGRLRHPDLPAQRGQAASSGCTGTPGTWATCRGGTLGNTLLTSPADGARARLPASPSAWCGAGCSAARWWAPARAPSRAPRTAAAPTPA